MAIIGTVGVPNRYGGFESFAECVAPALAEDGFDVVVTCDRAKYRDDLSPFFGRVRRLFVPVPANGALSPLHDLLAFMLVIRRVDVVLVLGVSAGLFFPMFRLVCVLLRRRLLVNIDGVEWRRTKFGLWRRAYLYASDKVAQMFAHQIVFDNEMLADYVVSRPKSVCIEYSGEQALQAAPEGDQHDVPQPCYALTICRIEPENNCELLIRGFLRSAAPCYVFVGNWNDSEYGRMLRSRYANDKRLMLLDPTYEAGKIYALRRGCEWYLHGHSVGGTNPSLVEVLFFDCRILCWDCSFNRVTADNAASFFASESQLAELINRAEDAPLLERARVRHRYSVATIVEKLGAQLRRVT